MDRQGGERAIGEQGDEGAGGEVGPAHDVEATETPRPARAHIIMPSPVSTRMRAVTSMDTAAPSRAKTQALRVEAPGPRMMSWSCRSSGERGAPRAATVGGRGDGEALDGGDPARAEAGVAEVAEADRQVGALGDQVVAVVRHHDVEAQPRVLACERGQRRQHRPRPVGHRHGDPDLAAQAVGVAGRVLRVLEVAQQLTRPLEEHPPDRGRLHAPRRAQQQLDPEARLELRHDPRDRRLRQPELPARSPRATNGVAAHPTITTRAPKAAPRITSTEAGPPTAS